MDGFPCSRSPRRSVGLGHDLEARRWSGSHCAERIDRYAKTNLSVQDRCSLRADVVFTIDQVTDPELSQEVYAILANLRDPALPPLAPLHSHHQHTSTESLTEDANDKKVDDDSADATLPILAVPGVRILASGPSLLIEVQLVLPRSTSLVEARRIELTVEREIKRAIGIGRVREVVVRMKAEDK